MQKYAESNGLTLCYERLGNNSAPAILLIAGLGEQLGEWPTGFCELLAGQGFQVIRYDNRDIGLSTKVASLYSLEDMADDACGLLSSLDIEAAHIVGMSMGGMIAQIFCAKHSTKALSLCSIMSSSGAEGLPGPTPEVAEMLTKKTDGSEAGFIENWVESKRRIDSPAYPADDQELYRRAKANCQRSFHTAGYMRHLNAINSNGSRVELLKKITCPTLVIHGNDDRLVPKECGIDTAKIISGARLEIVNGMGHNIPMQLYKRLCDLTMSLIKQSN